MTPATSLSSRLRSRRWTRDDDYTIATDPSLIPISQLTSIFSLEQLYWATPMGEDGVREAVRSSLCFALYKGPLPEPEEPLTLQQTQQQTGGSANLVGLARCVTDFTTFVYLTDVFVMPDHQGNGLGTWLVECVQEALDEMPYLRRLLMFTADWERSVPFYKKLMGVKVMECREGEGMAILGRKGPGNSTFGQDD